MNTRRMVTSKAAQETMNTRIFRPLSLLALLAVLLFSGCRKSEPETTLFVSIERLNYSLGSHGTTITLQATAAPTTDLVIPYHVAGEAKLGTDYELSAPNFILKAGETKAELQVKRLVEGEKARTFSILLTPPASGPYKVSLKNFAYVNVFGKASYQANFNETKGTVLAETTFGLRISGIPSGRYRVDEDTHLELEVDPSSTAVEGVHFAFAKNKEVIVPRREHNAEGLFTIRTLKVEEGHDKLVLRVAERDGFAEGKRRPTLTLTLAGPEDFSGTWKLKAWANAQFLADNYNPVKPAELIKPSQDDRMILTKSADGKSYTAELAFKDELSEYFGQGTRTLPIVGERSLSPEDTQVRAGYGLLLFTGANLTFDATQPEKGDVQVAFRLVPAEEAGKKPELEVLILKFKPRGASWTGFVNTPLPDDDYGFGYLRLRFTQE